MLFPCMLTSKVNCPGEFFSPATQSVRSKEYLWVFLLRGCRYLHERTLTLLIVVSLSRYDDTVNLVSAFITYFLFFSAMSNSIAPST